MVKRIRVVEEDVETKFSEGDVVRMKQPVREGPVTKIEFAGDFTVYEFQTPDGPCRLKEDQIELVRKTQ